MGIKYYQLNSPIILSVSGKDAARYLNNRLTADLRKPSTGTTLLAAALNPQGRVEGLFQVHIAAPDSFILVCDGGEKDKVIAAFKRYIVADRVIVEDRSAEYILRHFWCDDETLDLAAKLASSSSTVNLAKRQRLGREGIDVLVIRNESDAFIGSVSASQIEDSKYNLMRMIKGFPEFPHELNDSRLLLETGRKDLVTTGKGCYVGQEVVERIEAIGKAPRSMARAVFSGGFEPQPGDKVTTTDDVSIGEVVSLASHPLANEWRAFVLIKNGIPQSTLIRVGQNSGAVIELLE